MIRQGSESEPWIHARGWVIGRVFAHDVYHVAEINEALARAGSPLIDLWD